MANNYYLIENAELQKLRQDLSRPLGSSKQASGQQDSSVGDGMKRIASALSKMTGKSFTVGEIDKILKERASEVGDALSDAVKEIRKIAEKASLPEKGRATSAPVSGGALRPMATAEREMTEFAGMVGSFVAGARRMMVQFQSAISALSSPSMNMIKPVYASGGGPFVPRGTDTVPAMLTPGEFVVPADEARRHANLLMAIRDGKLDYMSSGGTVGGNGVQYLSAGGSVYTPGRKFSEATMGDLHGTICSALKDTMPIIMGSASIVGNAGRQSRISTRVSDVEEEPQSMGIFDKIDAKFNNLTDKFRSLAGISELYAMREMIGDVFDASKAINNLTGATLSTTDAVDKYQADVIWANNQTRRSFGFTTEQVVEAQSSILEYGVSSTESLKSMSDQALLAARAFGMGASDASDHFARIRRDLKLSVSSMSALAVGALTVAKQTGMTSRSVIEIQKGLHDQIALYRQIGARDTGVVESLTRQRAVGSQFGTEDILDAFRQSASGIEQFDQSLGKMGITVALARTELLNMRDATGKAKHTFLELQSGRILQTEGGRRDVMKATALALTRLQTTTENMPEEFANTFISQYTNGELKSRDALVNAIRSANVAGMSPREQVQELEAIKGKVDQMQKLGFSSSEISANLKNLATGFGDVNDVQSLNERMAAAKSRMLDEPTQRLAEAGEALRKYTQYHINSGVNDVGAARNMAFDDVKKQFQEINGSLGYTIDDLNKAVDKQDKLNAAALKGASDQSIQNQRDKFSKLKEQSLAIGMTPIEGLLSKIYPITNMIAAATGATAGAAVAIAGYIGVGKFLRGGMSLLGRGGGGGGSLIEAAGNVGKGGAAAGGGGLMEMLGEGGSRGGPSGPSARGGSVLGDSRSFLAELGKIAAVIGVVGLTMSAMSVVMPKAAVIEDTTEGLLVSLGAFSAFYVALKGMEKMEKFSTLDVGKMAKPIITTLGAMAVVGPALAGIVWATSKVWKIVPLAEVRELRDKVTESAPMLLGLLGAVVGMTAVGALASKVDKRVILEAAVAIPAILGGMAAVGYGLGKVMAATKAGWAPIATSDLRDLDEKFRASTLALGVIFASTAAIVGAGGVIGAIAGTGAGAAPVIVGLVGAAVAIPLFLNAMADVGVGLAWSLAHTIKAWSPLRLSDLVSLDKKVRAASSAVNMLMKNATTFSTLGVASIARDVVSLVAGGPAAAVRLLKDLGRDLAEVVSDAAKSWEGVSVEQATGLSNKVGASASVLTTLFTAALLFPAVEVAATAESIFSSLTGGTSATISKLGELGSGLGDSMKATAKGWDAVSVSDVQALDQKVRSSASALQSLMASSLLFTASGPMSTIGSVANFVGMGPASAIDQMMTVSESMANAVRRLASFYDDKFPDVSALGSTIARINELMAGVVGGIAQLAGSDGSLDGSTVAKALDVVSKVESFQSGLKTINTSSSSPGAGNTMMPIDMDGSAAQILAASTRSPSSSSRGVSDDVLEKLVKIAADSLKELVLIRLAMVEPSKSQIRKSGNEAGNIASMYTERTGEPNPTSYNTWSSALVADPSEGSQGGTG